MENWIKSRAAVFSRHTLIGLAAVAMIVSLAAYEFASPGEGLGTVCDACASGGASQRQQRQRSAFARSCNGDFDCTRHSGHCQRNRHFKKVRRHRCQPGDNDSNNDSNGLQQFFTFGFQLRPAHAAAIQIEHGLGSGVIISPDGYIVTNNHVIEGAVDINVTMTDRRILPAKLIGADPLTDLAVIKSTTNLPSVPLGDSTKLVPAKPYSRLAVRWDFASR